MQPARRHEATAGLSSDVHIADDRLAAIVDAWPILPESKKIRIEAIVSGRPRERQCPKCLIGRTRVKNSYHRGKSQARKMECVDCGHLFPTLVPREDVAPRSNRKKLAP